MEGTEITLGVADASLQLADADGGLSLRASAGSLDYVRATLRVRELQASARVSIVHGVDAPLATLFEDLAESWRGWKGSKTWAAYEGGLALACEHDGLGHITLTVELQEGAGYGWLARGDVPLEAGRLDVVAREVRRLETG
jgi:hypothetical protein